MTHLEFPLIDPVALSVGPIDIRWYALAYIAGFLLGLYALQKFLRLYPSATLTKDHLDDFLTYAVIGVILGGRLGYVLFYNPEYYAANPLEALMIWKGGMAFHGGLLGVIIAMIIFAGQKGLFFFHLADRIAVITPIGLFFGRIANFINGELYGRASDVSWAMIFRAGDVPRHPSQLYQAATEGLLLFILLVMLQRSQTIRDKHGMLAGSFLAGYGALRFCVEFTREPDAHLGLLTFGLSMGQILCLPMIMIGCGVIFYSCRK